MGDRLDVVLMPGMLCTGRVWDAQRPALAALPVTVRDWVSYGSSMPDLAGDAVAVGAGPEVLVGHSLGAIAALTAALAHPSIVAGLVLVSTTARAPRPEQLRAWRAQIAEVTGGGLTPAHLAARLIPHQVSPRCARAQHARDVAARMAAGTDPRLLLAHLQAQQTRIDLRPVLHRIDVPVLVVSGDDDTVCPSALHSELAAALPRAELATLPAAGHLLPLEAPDELADLVNRFVADLVPTGAVQPREHRPVVDARRSAP